MQLKPPLPGRADAPGAEWGEAWRSRTGRSTVTHAGMRCPGSRAPLNTHPWVQPGFTRASPSQPPPHHCRRAAAPETSGNGSSPKTQVLPLCFEGRPPLPSWSLSLPPIVTQIILSPHNFISFSFPPTHSPFSALTLTQSPSAHPAPLVASPVLSAMTTTSHPLATAATSGRPPPDPCPAASVPQQAPAGQPAARGHEQDLLGSSGARLQAQPALGCWPWSETRPETWQMPEHAGEEEVLGGSGGVAPMVALTNNATAAACACSRRDQLRCLPAEQAVVAASSHLLPTLCFQGTSLVPQHRSSASSTKMCFASPGCILTLLLARDRGLP